VLLQEQGSDETNWTGADHENLRIGVTEHGFLLSRNTSLKSRYLDDPAVGSGCSSMNA
jgi:hypothetical protein